MHERRVGGSGAGFLEYVSSRIWNNSTVSSTRHSPPPLPPLRVQIVNSILVSERSRSFIFVSCFFLFFFFFLLLLHPGFSFARILIFGFDYLWFHQHRLQDSLNFRLRLERVRSLQSFQETRDGRGEYIPLIRFALVSARRRAVHSQNSEFLIFLFFACNSHQSFLPFFFLQTGKE